VALWCSLLGTSLDIARRRGDSLGQTRPTGLPRVAKQAARLLAEDPALTAEQLGAHLSLSPSRVARVFKAAMGVSLVDYRNRVRLERFAQYLDETGNNLLEAALLAGFGSYAQFHRVFVAHRGTTPGRYAKGRSRR
jgi:AraC-like DNA-binding protein